MAIFQPTNITPDLILGEKNGVVLIPDQGTDPVTVSWQVNGNSPLVAYQIDFFRNIPNETTATASTGKITLGTPFSPVGADGTMQMFTCQVEYNKFGLAAGPSSNYQGKIRITQWWGATDNESIVQRSMSVYRKNYASSISIANVNGYNGSYSFTGAFSAPNPDYGNTTLLWTRWYAKKDEKIVYDTGKVWGATDYTWTPGVFYPGNYTVFFTAESSQGESLSDVASFTSMESQITIDGLISATCDRSSGSIAVDIEFSLPNVDGAVTGTPNYNYKTEQEVFRDGDEIAWQIPRTFDDSEWAFFWEGTFEHIQSQATSNVVEITQDGGTMFGISRTSEDVFKMIFPSSITLASEVDQGQVFRFVVFRENTIPTKPYICCFGVYDERGQQYSYTYHQMVGFTAGVPATLTIRGSCESNAWGFIYGGIHTSLKAYATDYSVTSPYGDGPYIEWQAYDGGIAANVIIPGGSLIQPIFRMNPDGSVTRIMNAVPGEQYGTVYDYGVANGESYQYFLVRSQYTADERNETSVLLATETVSPCFWEWTLIEAQRMDASTANTAEYYPVNVFRFRANVSSGSIGNGAAPSVYSTFTRYPVVMRDTQNRKSGTLTGLIGWVTAPSVYSDNNATMDAIRNLSATKNTLFLRSRRGELMKIAVAGEITTAANDNSLQQEITASIPWVEIGPVDGSIAR